MRWPLSGERAVDYAAAIPALMTRSDGIHRGGPSPSRRRDQSHLGAPRTLKTCRATPIVSSTSPAPLESQQALASAACCALAQFR